MPDDAPAATLLAIDAGNSDTVAGIFRDGRLAAHRRVPTDHVRPAEALVRELAAAGDVQATVVATPGPRLDAAYARLIPELLGHPPTVLVADPVGPDRRANAAAAHALAGGACIVVDLGTATTVDAVDGHGALVGGAIAPGLGISVAALAAVADRLAPVPLEAPAAAIGRDTAQAMRSGAVFGHAGLVDGLVARFRGELGAALPVVATGGLAGVVAPHCQTVDRVEPCLTLEGLRLLWLAASAAPAAAAPSPRA
jgi:type III pantothenate kinase